MGGPSTGGALFKMLGTAVATTTADSQANRNGARIGEAIKTTDAQAADAYQRGGVVAGLAREQGTQVAAQQAAAYGDAGVDTSGGTAADVVAETAIRAEHAANVITANAAREAWGFQRSKLDLERKRTDLMRQQTEADGAAGLSILSDFAGGLGGGG